MADNRTRSEYRLSLTVGQFKPTVKAVTLLADDDRAALAQLMLDGYHGTIDDEGEGLVEALEAVDDMLEHCLRPHSFVLRDSGAAIAMSLVAEVRATRYIDPIVVAADHKKAGLGRRMVETSLASLAAAGVREVGAVITDGNHPSERLFASVGATRVGSWPPATAAHQ